MNVGAHTVEVEDDVMIVRIRGSLDKHAMTVMNDLAAKIEVDYGYYLVIIDIHEFTAITPEVRRMAASFAEEHRTLGNAIVGGSVIMRSLMRLMARGIALFQPQKAFPVAFFVNEQQAREWIAAQRHKAKTPGVPKQGGQ